jgi:hypothetical protein
MIKQWRLGTRGLSANQIEFKFRKADTNGNGRLSRKEFTKLLAIFNLKMPDADVDLLMERFDVDGDGELDLAEFKTFVEREINSKSFDADGESTNATRSAPEMSLSSSNRNTRTILYDEIKGKAAVGENEKTGSEVSFEELFRKQKELEDILGKKYFHK